MNESLISVIIPAYNVAPSIRQAIESVLSQTYHHLEVIVIDDGSTDETVTVLEEVLTGDSRCTLIKQENQGAGSARNAGLNRAKGDYILFVDADDCLPPTAISDLYERAVQTQALATVGAIVYVYRKGKQTYRPVPETVWTTEQMIAEMYSQHVEFVIPGGKLFHRSLFEDLRFPQGKRFEDAFLLPKLYARAEKIALVAKQVYFYYQQREGNSITSTVNMQYLDRLDALKEVYMSYQDRPELVTIILKRLFQAKKFLWQRAIREKQWEVCRVIEGLYWDERVLLSKEELVICRQIYRQLKRKQLVHRLGLASIYHSLLSWKKGILGCVESVRDYFVCLFNRVRSRCVRVFKSYRRRFLLFVKKYRRKRKFGYFANCVHRIHVFPESRVCYVDVPKTASTSILKILLEAEGADVSSLPLTLHEYTIKMYSQDDFSKVPDYFSFAFVRNPFERVVSTYKNMYKKDPNRWSTFTNYLFGWFKEDKGFAYFVQKGPTQISDSWADEHCVSQHVIVCDQEGNPYVDFIGRFERLAEDWKVVQKRTGLPDLPHLNRTVKDDWRDYYTVELVEMVYRRYQKDIEVFGYEEEYIKLKAYLEEKEKERAGI